MGAHEDLVSGRAPAELIPGDLAAAEEFTHVLRTQGQRFYWAAADFAAVKVEWQGPAAAAYAAAAQANAKAWEHTSDCFARAGVAMAEYADALRQARTVATVSVGDFEDGLTAADQWARQAYQARTAELEQSGIGFLVPDYVTPPRPILAALPGGRALRDGAVAALDRARSDVLLAGDRAAAALRGATEGWSSGPPFGQTPGTSNDPGGKGNHLPINGPVPLGLDEFDLTRIRQGSIGDCWLLAALGAAGEANPDWFRQHLRLNPDGSYTVVLFRKNVPLVGPVTWEPVEVTVPASVISDGVRDSRTGQPSWASIYEKAVAAYRGGSYDGINGGFGNDALEMITGRPAETRNDPDLQSIRDGLASGRVYVVSTETQGSWWPFDDEIGDKRVVPDHAYMIDQVREVDGQLQVHVVNPWGPDGGSYNGDAKSGDLWLTEEQFHANFDHVSSVAGR